MPYLMMIKEDPGAWIDRVMACVDHGLEPPVKRPPVTRLFESLVAVTAMIHEVQRQLDPHAGTALALNARPVPAGGGSVQLQDGRVCRVERV
jgi:hypothetical protein